MSKMNVYGNYGEPDKNMKKYPLGYGCCETCKYEQCSLTAEPCVSCDSDREVFSNYEPNEAMALTGAGRRKFENVLESYSYGNNYTYEFLTTVPTPKDEKSFNMMDVYKLTMNGNDQEYILLSHNIGDDTISATLHIKGTHDLGANGENLKRILDRYGLL